MALDLSALIDRRNGFKPRSNMRKLTLFVSYMVANNIHVGYRRQDNFITFSQLYEELGHYDAMPMERKRAFQFWKRAVGQYIKECRTALGNKQDAGSLSRSAISELENGRTNFSLETLLDALHDVGGNISDAFQSRVPKKLHGPDQDLHERLAAILETHDPEALFVVRHAIDSAYDRYVVKRLEASESAPTHTKRHRG